MSGVEKWLLTDWLCFCVCEPTAPGEHLAEDAGTGVPSLLQRQTAPPPPSWLVFRWSEDPAHSQERSPCQSGSLNSQRTEGQRRKLATQSRARTSPLLAPAAFMPSSRGARCAGEDPSFSVVMTQLSPGKLSPPLNQRWPQSNWVYYPADSLFMKYQILMIWINTTKKKALMPVRLRTFYVPMFHLSRNWMKYELLSGTSALFQN